MLYPIKPFSDIGFTESKIFQLEDTRSFNLIVKLAKYLAA